jgi:hypothetical protein
MTQLLQQAFDKASKLHDAEQNTLATEILDELEAESRWDEALASSADAIDVMGEQALKEFQQHKTTPGGFDKP